MRFGRWDEQLAIYLSCLGILYPAPLLQSSLNLCLFVCVCVCMLGRWVATEE